MSFRDRPDPDESAVENDDDYAHYPESLSIVCAIVAEDDGEDDTTKVARGANQTRENTCRTLVSVPTKHIGVDGLPLACG